MALSYPGVTFPISWAALGFSKTPRLANIPPTNLRALANYAWWSYEREQRLVTKQVKKSLAARRTDIANGYESAFRKAASRYWGASPANRAKVSGADGADIRIQLGQLDKVALRAVPVSVLGSGKAKARGKLWSPQEQRKPIDIPDIPAGLGSRGDAASDSGGVAVGLGMLLLLLSHIRRRRR